MKCENWRNARQKCNIFENYRVAHRARIRLRAGMFDNDHIVDHYFKVISIATPTPPPQVGKK